eukprot:CAMPEP_0185830194 /NCGR_PEP_ID=MMETSP1353-20130828/677_1 /TAXON_ID=1077150 /ORGANISM="Erythrolobus australicus, Strain CCMP3124" /LENGTH=176 /DNA_ID=CAMNT_0028528059 /DNA_START=396 /DNA_END=926 /DNA_ORIENTATION=-
MTRDDATIRMERMGEVFERISNLVRCANELPAGHPERVGLKFDLAAAIREVELRLQNGDKDSEELNLRETDAMACNTSSSLSTQTPASSDSAPVTTGKNCRRQNSAPEIKNHVQNKHGREEFSCVKNAQQSIKNSLSALDFQDYETAAQELQRAAEAVSKVRKLLSARDDVVTTAR